ncbi:MAG: membrane protein insertase YidC [Candidatus Omnitrophica bacterium]|nr:membrane protein insertase YidC [Candidatus Omnitrophota bacterium]
MEKRLFLAVVLSLAVLVGWGTLVSKTQKPVSQQVVANIAAGGSEAVRTIVAEAPAQVPAGTSAPVQSAPSTLINFPQEKFDVDFIEELSAIKDVNFKVFQDYKYNLKSAFALVGKGAFRKELFTANTATFIHKDRELLITKKYIFSNSNYTIDLEIEVQNNSGAPIKLDLPLILGVLDFTPKSIDTTYLNVTAATNEKVLQENGKKEMSWDKVKFLAVRDRYFCAIIERVDGNTGAYVRKLSAQESEVGLTLKDLIAAPGLPLKLKFHIYLGPQQLQVINGVNRDWGAVINYGIFDFFGQAILKSLEFVQRLVGNWGWAIILLSVLVFLVLFPLTLKQMRSMKEMQILQPKIEELRKKYKDNPQKLNQETLALYKEHKVNPLGGCLPMLLQMPILFALYQVLMRSVALRGAEFLWIKDLSMPDCLFKLPQSIPVLGNEINILPILMTIGMFLQQKMSTVKQCSDSSTAQQQKIMMIAMPIMFLVFFYHLPAGLVLYWVVNSTLMMAYQFKIMRAR